MAKDSNEYTGIKAEELRSKRGTAVCRWIWRQSLSLQGQMLVEILWEIIHIYLSSRRLATLIVSRGLLKRIKFLVLMDKDSKFSKTLIAKWLWF